MTTYDAILELDGIIDCCECAGNDEAEKRIEAVRIAITAMKKQELEEERINKQNERLMRNR